MAHASNYQLIETDGVPIRAWIEGVPVEPDALRQLENVAKLPCVHGWVAAMPDIHVGIGATVGSVIATHGAIIPAAVGVDIGCGMMAACTSITASELPGHLGEIRSRIEARVPHGRTANGGRGDRGAWGKPPPRIANAFSELYPEFQAIVDKHPRVGRANSVNHLGTLGTGNHFIELCLDEQQRLWVMLHSGSRGIGNRIGSYFIELAKQDVARANLRLPDANLAYFSEGSEHFEDYLEAVGWAQRFAKQNRELMMQSVLEVLEEAEYLPSCRVVGEMINCHHNYVAQEIHQGQSLYVTRKGAVRAGLGEPGIIPGSMGARSYIVRGLGNPDSYASSSHGAGRLMARNAARKRFTLLDHEEATRGIECRKDDGVLDETPGAYKNIDAVMHAQRDLVEIVHTLRQVVCVKG